MTNEISIQPDGSTTPQNTLAKVVFREEIQRHELKMKEDVANGRVPSILERSPLKHYFTPKDPKYGCHTYARAMFLPKGGQYIGKIHKHPHLNCLCLGRVRVLTEFGEQHLTAGAIFISEIGLKRAVVAEEDSIWVTFHLTALAGEENLEAIEDELIAKTYEEIGLISSRAALESGAACCAPTSDNRKSKIENPKSGGCASGEGT
jgi:hypothetical protein